MGDLGNSQTLGGGVVAAQMWVMPLSTCSRAAQVQRAHAQPLRLALRCEASLQAERLLGVGEVAEAIKLDG